MELCEKDPDVSFFYIDPPSWDSSWRGCEKATSFLLNAADLWRADDVTASQLKLHPFGCNKSFHHQTLLLGCILTPLHRDVDATKSFAVPSCGISRGANAHFSLFTIVPGRGRSDPGWHTDGRGAVKTMPLWGCHSSEQHCGSLSSICLWPSGCWECCPSDNVLSTNDTWKQPWRQSERKIWIWTQRGERSGSLSIIWVAANRGQPWCTCSLNKRRNYLHEHNEKMFSHWWIWPLNCCILVQWQMFSNTFYKTPVTLVLWSKYCSIVEQVL